MEGGGGIGGEDGGRNEDVGIIQITLPLGTCGEVGTTIVCFMPLGFSWVETLVPSSSLVPHTI